MSTTTRTAPRAKPSRGEGWLAHQRADFVIKALGGPRAAAVVFHVSPSQTSRWARGQSLPDPDHMRVLLDLDHVLAAAMQVWDPPVALDWMTTANGFLDFARPIDVVVLRGSGEVTDALRAEATGAFA